MEGDCNVYAHSSLWMRPTRPDRYNAKMVYIIIEFIPGGGVLSPKSYVDVPAGPRKSDYLYINFLPNFPPISIPFSKEKHPILIILGAFYNNLPKIHPIYVIWAPSSLMKTPRSLYQISRKSAPKGRHIYVYHVNVRTPPPGGFMVGAKASKFKRYQISVYFSFSFNYTTSDGATRGRDIPQKKFLPQNILKLDQMAKQQIFAGLLVSAAL